MSIAVDIIKWGLLALLLAAVIAVAITAVNSGINVPFYIAAARSQGVLDGFSWVYGRLLVDGSDGGMNIGVVLGQFSATMFTGVAAIAAFRAFRSWVKA